jgi:tRNA-splicing ligase RtcB
MDRDGKEAAAMKRVDPYRIHIPREGPMRVDGWVYAGERIRIEDGAIRQLRDAACLPGVVRVIATPDIHFGYGVPIGCVLAMEDAIVPAAVGYDINCGMRLMTTPLRAAQVNVPKLTHSAARDIPLGEGKRNVHFSSRQLRVLLAQGLDGLAQVAGGTPHRVWEAYDEAEVAQDARRCEQFGHLDGDPDALTPRALERGVPQLATLGGGNHFVELQRVDAVLDERLADRLGIFAGQLVVMIHSGSRGLGHEVGGHYMKLAAQRTADQCPNRHLCFLPTDSPDGRNYIGAMNAAANFAFLNRELMTLLVRLNLRKHLGRMELPIIYDVPHNMAKLEDHLGRRLWVHRKGATRAFPASRLEADSPYKDVGQPVIIPGSMGTASYLLMGNEQSAATLHSVNHGAGRTMSRTKAAGKRRRGRVLSPPAISDEAFARAMRGVELIAADKWSAREEAPQAYKDIDAVMETVLGANLADGVARLVPLGVMKG